LLKLKAAKIVPTYAPVNEALYSQGGSVKNSSIVLLAFILFTFKVESNPHLYSGKVATFAESNTVLSLHSHGVKFNEKTYKHSRYSYIKLINKQGAQPDILIDNTPNLIALAWSVDGKYLLGVSNIKDNFSPHYIVFDKSGDEVARKKLNCESSINKYDSFFCSESSPEQDWSNTQINSLSISNNNTGLNVCIGQLCEMIAVNSIKQ